MRSASVLRRRRAARRPTVLIGKDTRISGYMIESALEAGFASAGVDVLLSGPLPTPGVAYLTRALRLDLRASSSAPRTTRIADNGIKFFSARGEKLPDAVSRTIEAALERPPRWVDSAELGKARGASTTRAAATSSSARARSRNELVLKGLKHRRRLRARRGLPRGAATCSTNSVPTSSRSAASPNGININDGVGATAPAALVARCAHKAPTTASRSTAMPTGC